MDDKWLRYQALKRAERKGATFDTSLAEMQKASITWAANSWVACIHCHVQLKPQNLDHYYRAHRPKARLRWGSNPLLQKQRRETQRLLKVAGKPVTRMISGGLPGLGKKR